MRDPVSKRGLLIRADAGPHLGIGHFMRSLTLARSWKARGRKVVLLSHCTISGLLQCAQNKRVPFLFLDRPHPDPFDLAQTVAMVKSGEFEWVILDGYHFDAKYQKTLRDTPCRLLIIDDMGHQPAYHADILLNQNTHARQLDYRYDPGTRLLLGLEYVLLRREFLTWGKWTRSIPDIGLKVLVTLGGGDPKNQTLRVINVLRRLDRCHLEAVVVIGIGSPYLSILEEAVETTESIRLAHNVRDMPELIAWADVAISAGGSTCYELAYMGLPNVILVMADNQRAIATELHNAGIAWNLGCYKTATEEQICDALQSLIFDKKRRTEMSKQGRQLIDGKGAQRVVLVMEGIHEAIPNR